MTDAFDLSQVHRTYQEEYIIEPLTLGWFCRNKDCGIFNGDLKEFLIECRYCKSPRPKHEHVVRGTKGK